MIHRGLRLALIGVGWAVLLAAVVWPAAALVASGVAEKAVPEGGFAFSGRQLGLLWRSMWMSGAAAGLCILVALPAAFATGRPRTHLARALIHGCMAVVLLCPPMVYAFAWERILPAGFNSQVRCIGVWVLWGWPIAAISLGAGWARAGRAAYESALLCVSSLRAFLCVGLPCLRHHLAFGALVLFTLFFGDYGVPHACGLIVYSTELLGWASVSNHTVDAAWPTLLPVLVIVLALWGARSVWHRGAPRVEDLEGGGTASGTGGCLSVVATLTLFVLAWMLPIGALFAKLASVRAFREAIATYRDDIVVSLVLAVLAGVAAVACGLGTASVSRGRRAAVGAGILFGAVPGVPVGEALVAAYGRIPMVYDSWSIVALSYISRFVWVGLLAAAIASTARGGELADQARSDGAGEGAVLTRVLIPMNWALFVGAAAVVAALSVADVATSSVVRVPGFTPVAQVIIEKFHRLEDGMLIALSLCLVAAALPAGLLISAGLRRR